MGKYFVDFEPKAKEEIKAHLKSGNKANIKKLEKIKYNFPLYNSNIGDIILELNN